MGTVLPSMQRSPPPNHANNGDEEEFEMVRIVRFLNSEEGATMVEYALMVTFIALVCIAAVTLLGGNLSAFFTNAANSI